MSRKRELVGAKMVSGGKKVRDADTERREIEREKGHADLLSKQALAYATLG